ncbi:hypothetical protein [Nocardia camponoti]|nr:hypothetical protein [Nocardia camponoti]
MSKVDVSALSPELSPLWHVLHHRLGCGRPVSTVKVRFTWDGTELVATSE